MKKIKYWIDSYDIGKEYKKEYDDLEYALRAFLDDYDADSIDAEFFVLGFNGKEKPVPAEGWRYGEFTDYGDSKNHASGNLESGISLMAVYVKGILKDKASTASELFMPKTKKKFYVKGYWTPDIWGSDGEPLMLVATHMKEKPKWVKDPIKLSKKEN